MMNILTQEEINWINDLCKQYKIKDYTINSDGSIDVDGHVNICDIGLTSLPLRFNVVLGDFNCSYNKLTTLEGCPKSVCGSFNCIDNFLTSLEFSPISVGNNFNCSYNNNLTSLEFSPKFVGGVFCCSFNKLTSLEFSPKEIGGNFYCDYNRLPDHFIKLYNKLKSEEIKIFVKYHHHMRIWDGGYDQEATQLLLEEIKDGLL